MLTIGYVTKDNQAQQEHLLSMICQRLFDRQATDMQSFSDHNTKMMTESTTMMQQHVQEALRIETETVEERHKFHAEEIKAQLEPKEQQIESLKMNLADLEKLFEMHTKSLKLMRENAKQKDNLIEELIKDEKRAKVATQKAQNKISEFISDVQKAVQC